MTWAWFIPVLTAFSCWFTPWPAACDHIITYCAPPGYTNEVFPALVAQHWRLMAIPSCDNPDLDIIEYWQPSEQAGWWRGNQAGQTIWINMWARDAAFVVDSVWEKALMHEVGHCLLGPIHHQPPSAMYRLAYYFPTEQDRQRVAAIYGW